MLQHQPIKRCAVKVLTSTLPSTLESTHPSLLQAFLDLAVGPLLEGVAASLRATLSSVDGGGTSATAAAGWGGGGEAGGGGGDATSPELAGAVCASVAAARYLHHQVWTVRCGCGTV